MKQTRGGGLPGDNNGSKQLNVTEKCAAVTIAGGTWLKNNSPTRCLQTGSDFCKMRLLAVLSTRIKSKKPEKYTQALQSWRVFLLSFERQRDSPIVVPNGLSKRGTEESKKMNAGVVCCIITYFYLKSTHYSFAQQQTIRTYEINIVQRRGTKKE